MADHQAAAQLLDFELIPCLFLDDPALGREGLTEQLANGARDPKLLAGGPFESVQSLAHLGNSLRGGLPPDDVMGEAQT